MKSLLFLPVTLLAVLVAFGQSPSVQWGKYVHFGNQGTTFYHASATIDGGFITCGEDSMSLVIDTISKFFLKNDRFSRYSSIRKFNSMGNLQWKTESLKIYGSMAIIGEKNSGQIFSIGSNSLFINNIGTVSQAYIVSFDTYGNFLWEKKYGGTKPSGGLSIDTTNENGFIACGYTEANDGDISGNHGLSDAWLIKTDSLGNKIWAKCLGGSANDTAFAVITVPGGYLVAGTTASTDGDAIGSKGGHDGWVVKLDTAGNIAWQKKFGGTSNEALRSIQYDTVAQVYLFSGYSTSTNGDVSGNHGAMDVWVLKTDTSGNLLWSKTFGGSLNDASTNIRLNTDNKSYFVSGFTTSGDGDVLGNAGGTDAWLLNINLSGKLVWQKCIGTKRDEYAMAAVPVNQSDVIIAGFTEPTSLSGSNCRGLIARLGPGNTITGKTFYDANKNGLQDAGENLFDQVAIIVESNYSPTKTINVYDGSYTLGIDTGSYTISAKPYNPYFTASPLSTSVSHNTYYNTDTINFAIQPIPGIKDVAINLLPITPARPGFAVQYKLIAANNGTASIPSATAILVKDSRLIYQYASPAPNSVSGDTLRWALSNFAPADTASFIINFKAATPPMLANGTTLVSSASIPLENDSSQADNNYTLKQLVTGSYDPNDKREAHGGIITEEQLASDGWLNYLIRFQNTGTDTAFSILITDTLSSKLDWASLQMTDASHAYQMQMQEGHITWKFEGIKLVDSIRNEPKSHGYIAYRIKPAGGLKWGDTITNKADIYFDYNLPVATNTDLLKVAVIAKEDTSIVRACPGGTAFFTVLQANAIAYSWEVDNGTGFISISEGSTYIGSKTAQLKVTGPTSWTGNKYRCRMLLTNDSTIYNDAKVLRFVNTWTGATNANWMYAGNWSCGVLPDANTDVIVKSPANNGLVVTANVSCRSITLTGPNIYVWVNPGIQLTITGK